MMPDASIFETFGSLAGIIAVVWFFLNHISKVTKGHAESLKQMIEENRVESMTRRDEMMKHLDRGIDVISGNTKALGANSAVLIQATDVLRDVSRTK